MAKIVSQLPLTAQFRPWTIKTCTLIPKLCKAGQFHPSGDVACHRGRPSQHPIGLELQLTLKCPNCWTVNTHGIEPYSKPKRSQSDRSPRHSSRSEFSWFYGGYKRYFPSYVDWVLIWQSTVTMPHHQMDETDPLYIVQRSKWMFW